MMLRPVDPRLAAGWLVLLVLCTGAYRVLPGSGFVLLPAGLALLAMDPLLRGRPAELLPARMLAGVALFNAVFMLYGVWHGADARLQVVHVYSLLCCCVGFAIGSAALRQAGDRRDALALAVCLAGLLLLLFGQWAQIRGWIAAPDERFERKADLALALRPGGFLNPNTTAAIALVLLYAAGLHRRPSLPPAGAALGLLAVTVVALTQSRAALLALAVYAAVLGRRHPLMLLLLAGLLGVGSFLAGWWDRAGLLFELVDRFAGRFSGDGSSSDRAFVLARAWEHIQQAPWLGHGQGWLVRTYGMGSHNQLAELWVNHGLLGALPMLLAGALMLGPVSALFLVVCVLPSFLFSHNYFDNAPFQAALGLALATAHAARARGSAAQVPGSTP